MAEKNLTEKRLDPARISGFRSIRGIRAIASARAVGQNRRDHRELLMQTTSLTLLHRVRQTTDQVAWKRFVELYTPLLANWARRAGLMQPDVDDVVQDVLLVLMKDLPKFQYDREQKSFRGWLKTITFNKVRDRQRRKEALVGQMQAIFDQQPDQHSALDALWDQEYNKHLTQQALRIMQTDFALKTWQACWETTVNDRAAKDVARELEMSEAAVFVAKSRVLRRLREELAGLLD